MTRSKIGIPAVGCLLLLGSTNQVTAGIVTWEMSGTIFQVFDPDDFLGGQISQGSPFSLTFSFDSDIPDSDTSDHRGVFDEALTEYSGTVGPLSFEIHPGGFNSILMSDGRADRDLFAPGASVEFENFVTQSFVNLFFRDGILDVNTLPILVPNLGDEVSLNAVFSLDFGPLPGSALGSITQIVPEPRTLALLSFSILAGAFVHKRNKNSTKH